MPIRSFTQPKAFLLPTLVLLLVFAVACSSAAPEGPRVVEKEVIVEVPVEKEVVTKVEVEIVNEVVREVMVTPTPRAVAKGQTFESPLRPDWVSQGKYQSMVLDVVGRGRIGQWDVHYCGSGFSCLIGATLKVNGLFTYNPVNPSEVIGDLAKSWETNADGTTYTIRLHDAQWHDGTPVTAEDIVYSFDRLVEPGSIRSRTAALKLMYAPGTARAIDEKTLVVPLLYPAVNFTRHLALEYYAMYPKKTTQGLSQEDANCCPENIIGSGPWLLSNWDRGTVREYSRNPNYFKTDRPFFDGLRFNVIRDFSRILTALQVGQAFVSDGPWSGSYRPEDVFKLQDDTNGRLRTMILSGATWSGFILHQNRPPFDDARVRRAFYLSMDRHDSMDIAYCTDEYGCFADLGTFFPLGTVETESVENLATVPGWRQVNGQKDPQDLEEAKQLLAQAGYPDGFEADMNLGDSANSIRVAEVVTEQMRTRMGMDFTLKPLDTAGYHVATRDGLASITWVSASGLLIRDPEDILGSHFAKDIEKNPDDWTQPEFAKGILSQARELDSVKRQQTFQEMVEILRQGESHVVPNVWVGLGAAMDYRLQNWHLPQSTQHVHKWDHVWWDPEAACPDSRGCQ